MPRPKGSKNSKPKPHKERTPTEIQSMRARIQELDLMGWAQTRIAKEIGRSQGLVSMELKAIRQEYFDSYVDDRKALTMRELAVVARVRAEAFEQLEKLKAGKNKRRKESGDNAKGGFSKDVEEHEDVEYSGVLNVLLDTVRETAALMGLKELPAITFQIDNRQQQINLLSPEGIMQLILGNRAQPSAIEDKLKEVEGETT